MENSRINRIWLILGLFGIMDTLYFSLWSNMNLGILLPMILGLPLFVYGLFYAWLRARMKKGFGRFLRDLFIAGYTLFAALFLVCTALMVSASAKIPQSDAGAVIILGGGLKGDELRLTLRQRLDTALDYLSRNPSCLVVVSGGQGPGETVTEASAMAQYLIGHGIGADRILLEERSTNTLENMAYSKQLLDTALGNDYRVLYVTSEFHVYRAGLDARHVGLQASGLSSPSPWYLYPNNFLRETIAIAKTWVFGVE